MSFCGGFVKKCKCQFQASQMFYAAFCLWTSRDSWLLSSLQYTARVLTQDLFFHWNWSTNSDLESKAVKTVTYSEVCFFHFVGFDKHSVVGIFRGRRNGWGGLYMNFQRHGYCSYTAETPANVINMLTGCKRGKNLSLSFLRRWKRNGSSVLLCCLRADSV